MATDPQTLTREYSAAQQPPTIDDRLPSEVITCLQNARFLHLATCTHNIPHVSLMNYTYLPSHPFPTTTETSSPSAASSSSVLLPAGPTIIMTTNPDSKKTTNLITNPNVSLLVHEWVSSRPSNTNTTTSSSSTTTTGPARERSPPAAPRSSLAAMLMQMNSTAVSSISATLNGEALVLPVGSEEERWCKAQHLANNTFAETEGRGGGGDGGVMGGGEGVFGGALGAAIGGGAVGGQTRGGSGGATTAAASSGNETGDGGRERYIEDRDVRVVVVRIRDGRVSDWKGGVKDFILAPPGEGARMVNGV